MIIGNIKPYSNTSFKNANININAFSDTHGELCLANNALEEMRLRQKDIFLPRQKGNANITAICGDWFMDGSRTGYLSNPTQENGIFQLKIFNKFIEQLKQIAPNNITLFTPGNHDFDGGVNLLSRIFQDINAQIIMSNLDFENSPAFEKSIIEEKLVSQKIIEVDDDKNPDLKHKILFLGISPVNLVSYQKDLEGVTLIDNKDKGQVSVQREDYERTLDYCKNKIKEFKDENPKGIVILMSHTGVNFADNLARESTVNLIFDGHEHKEDIRVVNNTPIIPLSQNFKRIANTQIKIDDNGKIDTTNIKLFYPLTNKVKGPLYSLYHQLFKQDINPSFSIQTQNPNLEFLSTKNIRCSNNFLANFITDSVLEEIQKIDPSVDFLAINSSSIRRSLRCSKEKSISNFDILNVLSGLKEEDGQIVTTKVSGKELAFFVLDNIMFNDKAPAKNPLIQYSGLIIDRAKMFELAEMNAPLKDYTSCIINAKTNEPISPDKEYTIANTIKYFNKSPNPQIKEYKKVSKQFGYSVHELFKKHFIESDGTLFAKCDVRI